MLSYNEASQRLMQLRGSCEVPMEATFSYMEKRFIELMPMSEPHFVETLVWIGRFAHQGRYWELTIDSNGNLIRLNKSR